MGDHEHRRMEGSLPRLLPPQADRVLAQPLGQGGADSAEPPQDLPEVRTAKTFRCVSTAGLIAGPIGCPMHSACGDFQATMRADRLSLSFVDSAIEPKGK